METLLAQIDTQKKEIDSYRPFSKHVVQQFRAYFRVGLTYSSNALEGNTLTESETKVVLEDGITIGGRSLREHLEATGHASAYDFMLAIAEAAIISEDDILKLHRLFYESIDREVAGAYRSLPVIITGTDYIPPAPELIPGRMNTYFQDLGEMRNRLHPVHFAAHAHAGIANIHPFVDGNGRTARLAMNAALLQTGFVITILPPVLRQKYILACREANKGNAKPFIELIEQQVFESQKDYLRMLKSLQPQERR